MTWNPDDHASPEVKAAIRDVERSMTTPSAQTVTPKLVEKLKLLSKDELIEELVGALIGVARITSSLAVAEARVRAATALMREIETDDHHGRYGRVAREAIAALSQTEEGR